jgi:hypothetical protein
VVKKESRRVEVKGDDDAYESYLLFQKTLEKFPKRELLLTGLGI